MLTVMDADSATRAVMALYPEIYRLLARRLEPGARRQSPEALAVLGHLAQTGPATVTEAAAHFDRSQSATSELVDRLVARGLVERMRDERDRRRHLVWLTPEGLRALRVARQVLDPPRLAHALETLSPQARVGLVASLEALVEAARSRHGEEDDDRNDHEV